jgi:hypothetical protein
MAEGLWADRDLTYLQGLRDKINEKRAAGVLSFSYNGQSFNYASPAQMLVVAQEIQREIRRKKAAANGRIPASQSLYSIRRPLAE